MRWRVVLNRAGGGVAVQDRNPEREDLKRVKWLEEVLWPLIPTDPSHTHNST